MDDNSFPLLSHTHIAIIGLGLMGGSLAQALQGRCAGLLGLDPDPQTLAYARQINLMPHVSANPLEILPAADAVILAAPVNAIVKWLGRLPDFISQPCIVMDLGSTKTAIVQAMSALPECFDPIGGHPICGKEKLSLAHAEAGLYQGAPFVLTPLDRTSPRARQLTQELVQIIGANPLWLDAETHDRWIASTSHLPYLISAALALAAPEDAAPLVGPGFRSTSRLAATPDTMMLDVLLSNRANVLQALGQYRQEIEKLESALKSDPSALQSLLRRAAARRGKLVGN